MPHHLAFVSSKGAVLDVSGFGVSHNCAQVPLNAGNKPFAAMLSRGESMR
jgi:hypothetical protein